MTGLITVTTILLLCAAPARAATSQPAQRPNVILLFSDQQRGQALGVAGNDQIRTPHLDRLASEGIYLPNMIASSPVCCPARATMLTGKYPHRHGVMFNDLRLRESQVTLAELFAKAGYRTGFIGKWHLDGGKRQPGFVPPGPRRQGFAYWAANECDHRHFGTHYFRDTPEPIEFHEFEPTVWTDRAIEFVRGTEGKPFFLMVGFGPPHDPYGAPPEYERLYDAATLKMRPNWKPGTHLGSREDIAKYYAAITAIDDQVQRLLDVLDELKIADDTIVLFTSDHGDMLGSHGEFLKNKPWEESIRVPGIFRYPREIKPGQTSDLIFTHVDVAPTLLGLCGLPVPADMQGRDLSGSLTGRGDDEPDAALLQIFIPTQSWNVTPWRGIRTKRYVYARWEDKPWVLYDLQRDPYELTNLADDPDYAALRERLDERLRDEMQRVGDRWNYNVHKEYPLHSLPAVYSIDELKETDTTK